MRDQSKGARSRARVALVVEIGTGGTPWELVIDHLGHQNPHITRGEGGMFQHRQNICVWDVIGGRDPDPFACRDDARPNSSSCTIKNCTNM